METGRDLNGAVFVATDAHYFRSAGAEAAVIVTADAVFSDVPAERTEFLPGARSYRLGRVLPARVPTAAGVLDDLSEMRLLVVDGYADLDPDGRPGRACACRVCHPSDRRGQDGPSARLLPPC
jgi:deoxyribonuclease V